MYPVCSRNFNQEHLSTVGNEVSRAARRHRTCRELRALRGERERRESRIEAVFKIGFDSLRVGNGRKLRELI
jgi:hypothetical protein